MSEEDYSEEYEFEFEDDDEAGEIEEENKQLEFSLVCFSFFKKNMLELEEIYTNML